MKYIIVIISFFSLLSCAKRTTSWDKTPIATDILFFPKSGEHSVPVYGVIGVFAESYENEVAVALQDYKFDTGYKIPAINKGDEFTVKKRVIKNGESLIYIVDDVEALSNILFLNGFLLDKDGVIKSYTQYTYIDQGSKYGGYDSFKDIDLDSELPDKPVFEIKQSMIVDDNKPPISVIRYIGQYDDKVALNIKSGSSESKIILNYEPNMVVNLPWTSLKIIDANNEGIIYEVIE